MRCEELVLDAEATVRRICHFLGEAHKPSMRQLEDHIEARIPGREMLIH